MRRSSRRLGTVLVSTSTIAAALTVLPSIAAAAPSGPSTTSPMSSHRSEPAARSALGVARGSVDVRVATTRVERDAVQRTVARVAARPAVQSLRSSLGAQGIVDVDGFTGTPRQVARVDGFLTNASTSSARSVALAYVRAHPDLFGLSAADLAGLRLARDYVDVAGTHHLSWLQTAGGLDLFGNGLKANVAKDGRLISVLGSPVRGLQAPSGLSAPQLAGARAAVSAARKDLGEASVAPTRGDGAVAVLFQTAGGTRRAWQVVTMGAAKPALHVLDAETGRVLYRASLSADANGPSTPKPAAVTLGSKASVYPNYPGAPRGGSPVTVDLAAKGWLPQGAPVLFGNNAHTYTDINDDNAAQSTEEIANQGRSGFQFSLVRTQVTGQPCTSFVCTWDPNVAGSWNANRNRTATNNFYLVNAYHDHRAQAPIGFTEAAGNFQQVNGSGKGKGGDPVLDEPLDGASTAAGLPDANHIDNANMSTPPDGQSPRMQMYLFSQPGATYPTQDPFLAVSGADEADIVYHEYTHGLSNRLVVDAAGVSTLNSAQAGSMGEAWSDWYAFDLLVNQGYAKDTSAPGEVRVGDYVGAKQDLIRTQPLDCPVGTTSTRCPGTPGAGAGGYTYGDLGHIIGRPEVHADGEIWGETLWDLRSRLGSRTSESLVTRAMELSPADPSFLDMRNSILQADKVVYGGKHLAAIWQVFATRGMGYFAATVDGSDTAPVEDFSVPPAGAPTATLSGTVADSATGATAAGVSVLFGGHASGFAGDLAATTDASGRYRISGIYPGRYADVVARGAGYLPTIRTLSLHQGSNVVDWSVVRDWAAISGGASVVSTNGDEYASFGCGPAAALDTSQGTGWSTDLPAAGADKNVVVKLPQGVAVSAVRIDPAGACGDDISASTGGYQLQTSTDGTTWVTASAGTFTRAQIGTLAPVVLNPAATSGVRYVRYAMLTSQAAALGVDCVTRVTSGCLFVDTSEIVVEGKPVS